jgi:hypothetical protein
MLSISNSTIDCMRNFSCCFHSSKSLISRSFYLSKSSICSVTLASYSSHSFCTVYRRLFCSWNCLISWSSVYILASKSSVVYFEGESSIG